MTDDFTYRTKWEPTPEEFDAYLKREIEMAKANMAFLRASKTSIPGNTLHSQLTLIRASIGE